MGSHKRRFLPCNSCCVCSNAGESTYITYTIIHNILNTNAQYFQERYKEHFAFSKVKSGKREHQLEGKYRADDTNKSHNSQHSVSPAKAPHLDTFFDLSGFFTDTQHAQLHIWNGKDETGLLCFFPHPIYLAYLPLVLPFSGENCTPSKSTSFPGARVIAKCLNQTHCLFPPITSNTPCFQNKTCAKYFNFEMQMILKLPLS